MGRRQTAQLDLAMFEEEPAVDAPPAAPVRRGRSKPEAAPRWSDRKRRWVFVCLAAAVALGSGFAAYQLDQYLASDAHFVLPGGPDFHPNLTIEGAVYASERRVVAAFERDFGRSVYLIPLAERRHSLRAIDWIHDAFVERRWPNRVAVRIVERAPVAFAMLPHSADSSGAISYEPALVDADGVLLTPPRARFNLPALYGLTREQTVADRRERVSQALELMDQVKAYAGQISEINAADPANLTITFTAQGRALRLMLGKENYLERLKGFLDRYNDISRRLPHARVFDLRLYPHVTAQDGAEYGR